MQTKHLSVLNHMRNKGDAGTVKNVEALKYFFTDHSQAVGLLWIIFDIFVSCYFALSLFAVLCLRCRDRVSNC